MKELLKVNNLSIKIEEKVILRNLNISINTGEIHILMGPNGAGKSTLANIVMGNPLYEVIEGEIFFEGEDVLEMSVDERAKKGMFMTFQNPISIKGITVENFLKTAKTEITGERQKTMKFHRELQEKMEELNIDQSYSQRYLNDGFSGGERKKNEILQLGVLNPKLAFLDEIDSGLDVDAMQIVSQGVDNFHNENNSLVIITHQNRLLDKIKPNFVHVIIDGSIVKTGDISLAYFIERNGYNDFK